ncbi:hypothetical protein DFJ58DRAFT_725149 [Suillus subalutaceus]|uniref:uncharacterized protein n=1 Tax=Suillus subalutaceus TaxID=48586 RepID=UPI001B866B5B|nr:uncharacterized protein DFJ58DRAFT_725149 [Suillus subalutaceus]KAG1863249.1 hypothetical protein DFJ58DRAFT_725149 [Suillus subalutaceus]
MNDTLSILTPHFIGVIISSMFYGFTLAQTWRYFRTYPKDIWSMKALIHYDFMNSRLERNQTYAYRLPPTFIEKADGCANYHENVTFCDMETVGIENIAGRSIIHTILRTLQRISFDEDLLKLLLLETSYRPLTLLFRMMETVHEHPQLTAIPNHASCLELLYGPLPELRAFVRIKFKNGTNKDFQTYPIFTHKGNIVATRYHS